MLALSIRMDTFHGTEQEVRWGARVEGNGVQLSVNNQFSGAGGGEPDL